MCSVTIKLALVCTALVLVLIVAVSGAVVVVHHLDRTKTPGPYGNLFTTTTTQPFELQP